MPTTAWLEPPQPINGQDHLGTIAVCETLYAQLLPGITNVTDRARCYAFYPWFMWALDRAGTAKDPAKHKQLLRRAECLWCLIAMQHEDGRDSWAHGATLAGRNNLRWVWDQLQTGAAVPFDAFAPEDVKGEGGKKPYFQADLGGFSQYYLGTLRTLDIADVRDGFLRFGLPRGLRLARAFDHGVSRTQFLEAIHAERVTRQTLIDLAPFCPCYLTANRLEQQELVDLFFNVPNSDFHEVSQTSRRQSLLLILDLIGAATLPAETQVEVDTLRAALYGGALPGGQPWLLPPDLEATRVRWATYQRTDLLSVAVQTLFWAALVDLEEARIPLPNASAVGRRFVDRFGPTLGTDLAQPIPTLLAQVRAGLPPLTETHHPVHEMARHLQLVGLTRRRNNLVPAVQNAWAILLALLGRDTTVAEPHAGFELEPGFVQRYPITLAALRRHAQAVWQHQSVGEVLAWLVSQWLVETHFRVALFKLRTEHRDTFRLRPDHDGLEVIGPWGAAYSQPRLAPALQILRDLGTITVTAAGGTALTPLGVTLRGSVAHV